MICIMLNLHEKKWLLRRSHLKQAEHSVAYVETVPPVVVGNGTVTLPHGVHPLGQRLRGKGRVIIRI